MKRPPIKTTETLASRLHTQTGVEEARARLRERSAAALADFIQSLAQDAGPVGDQVRTFIVGDNVPETVAAVREQIARLELPTDYQQRHARGHEIGVALELILDSIERLLYQVDCEAAFECSMRCLRRMRWPWTTAGIMIGGFSCAFERAAPLMAAPAKTLPRPCQDTRIDRE